eukprot:100385-Chlamydomonas_euryale.AAC.21
MASSSADASKSKSGRQLSCTGASAALCAAPRSSPSTAVLARGGDQRRVGAPHCASSYPSGSFHRLVLLLSQGVDSPSGPAAPRVCAGWFPCPSHAACVCAAGTTACCTAFPGTNAAAEALRPRPVDGALGALHAAPACWAFGTAG